MTSSGVVGPTTRERGPPHPRDKAARTPKDGASYDRATLPMRYSLL